MNKEALVLEKRALLAFSYFGRIGPRRFLALEKRYGSAANALAAAGNSWRQAGLSEKLIDDFISWKKYWKPETAEKILTAAGIDFLGQHDPHYPKRWRQIPDPPFIIYYRGGLKALEKLNKNDNGLAVVGSRQSSPYAKVACSFLLPPVIKEGIVIISGLALGVDSLAHQAALENKAPTIAILGSGLDEKSLYPPANRYLAREICSNGGILLSEFPPASRILPINFRRRNRLISGLAPAVLIIEAGKHSGALITAGYALEQGREVLAVPGNILSENSAGTNRLLSEGAKLVAEPQDILDLFPKNLDEKPKLDSLAPNSTLNNVS